VKDPFCGLSHGIGAIVSVIGLVVLLLATRGDVFSVVAVSIYGASMIFLFSSSALAHSIHCSPRTDSILERIDYAAIFCLIAGTYTPICLIALSGAWGWSLLGVEWGLALLGITMVLWHGPQRMWVLLYVPMGWMVLIAVWPLVQRMEWINLLLLLLAGIIYTLGAIVFLLKRPRLWPGVFGSHDLWHVMVLLAAGLHFVVVARIVT
jgi:hemolysin III